MSIAFKESLPPPAPVVPPPPRVHRFTIEQYERMGELGFLTTRDRVELLEGWIVDKMTQYPPHATTIDLLVDAVRAVLPTEWIVRDQKPIHANSSMPEPDVAIVPGPRRRYAKRHPAARDVALVIEVADTSLEEDRERKGRIYAAARIPVYWIVNIPDGLVEVYTQPRTGKAPSYRRRQDFTRKGELPLSVAGSDVAWLAVRDILPS
jgi:Uma2 family endonuclease